MSLDSDVEAAASPELASPASARASALPVLDLFADLFFPDSRLGKKLDFFRGVVFSPDFEVLDCLYVQVL